MSNILKEVYNILNEKVPEGVEDHTFYMLQRIKRLVNPLFRKEDGIDES